MIKVTEVERSNIEYLIFTFLKDPDHFLINVEIFGMESTIKNICDNILKDETQILKELKQSQKDLEN